MIMVQLVGKEVGSVGYGMMGRSIDDIDVTCASAAAATFDRYLPLRILSRYVSFPGDFI